MLTHKAHYMSMGRGAGIPMCVDVLVASPDGPKELSQMVQCRGGGEEEPCKGFGINTLIQTGQQKNKSSTLLRHDK